MGAEAIGALTLWHTFTYCKLLGVARVMGKGDALNVLKSLDIHRWNYRLDAVRVMKREFELFSSKNEKKKLNIFTD